MEELIFLFRYQRLDPTTRRNFELLRRYHPGDRIVPLCYRWAAGDPLPGTVDVAPGNDRGWPISEQIWRDVDKIYLRWFLTPGRPRARRYVFFESSIRAQTTAQHFFGPAWFADAAAAQVITPQTAPEWNGWQERAEVEPWLHEHLCRVAPLAGSLWTHDALARIASTRACAEAFGELRMGTLARHHGLRIAALPRVSPTFHTGQDDVVPSDEPTWFYPVTACADIPSHVPRGPGSAAAGRRFLVYCALRDGRCAADLFGPDRQFDVAICDYGDAPDRSLPAEWWFASKTQKLEGAALHLPQVGVRYSYYAFLDDDIEVTTGQLNALFQRAEDEGLELFQPALTRDSPCSYAHTLQAAASSTREVAFVEMMAPFFSRRALDRCLPSFTESQSGWGLDIHAWPALLPDQKLHVVDACPVRHRRAVQAAQDRPALPNGLTPLQELRRMEMRYKEQPSRLHVFVNDGQRALLERFLMPSLQDDWVLVQHALPITTAASFGTPAFRQIAVHRVRTLVEEILPAEASSGRPYFVYSDVDVQFFDRCEPILDEALADHDIAFQAEFGQARRDVNTGFMAMRPSAPVRQFWQQVRELLDRDDTAANEQEAVNRLLPLAVALKWRCLPDEVWAWSNHSIHPFHPRFAGIRLHHANDTVPRDGMMSIELKLAQLRLVRDVVSYLSGRGRWPSGALRDSPGPLEQALHEALRTVASPRWRGRLSARLGLLLGRPLRSGPGGTGRS